MSQFKRKLSAFTAMLALISFSGAAMAVNSSHVIGKTSNASVVDTSSTRTDINVIGGQKGAVAQVDFSKFNVAKGEHVNYGFSNVSQTMINRVLGGAKSDIRGRITNSCIDGGYCTNYANTGKVILINPAGVLFGQGSTVDLNSFTVSTFDFNGAKNLKNMTEAQLDSYQANILNKLSPNKNVNGTNNAYGNIKFDSNYTQAFEDAGIDMSQFAGKTKIELNGTHFNKFTDETNTQVAGLNTNKSTNFISDNIDYKDSLIRTGDNFNYGDFNKSFGNVRIVTADGVTFRYLENGYTDAQQVAESAKDVTRNISMDNSGLAADKTGIDAGGVYIVNQSNNNSNVKIKDTLIKGRKMVNGENGSILITASNDIDIQHSRIDTVNTEVSVDGNTSNTLNKTGGIVHVSADGDLKVSNSVIATSGTKATSDTAADVRLYSQGKDVTIDNVRIVGDGNVKAMAYNDVTINNSLLQATNTVDKSQLKNVKIAGSGDINIKNAAVDGSGDVDIYTKYSTDNVAGNINISSDKKNGQNQTLINAGNNLAIEGKNTTLDDASLAYKTIKFYGKNTKGLNNVTVKNDSTFSPKKSEKSISPDVTLETNGNFTMDKATMRAAGFSLKLDRENPNDENSALIDDGTADAIGYNISISPANANNLTVTSTQGNVVAKNGSDITTTNTTFNSLTKNVDVQDSTLTSSNDINVNAKVNASATNSKMEAGNDVNVTAEDGALTIKNSTKIAADRNINLTSHDTINFGNDSAASTNIGKSSDIKAGNNITVKSTAGDITGEKTTMPILKYGNRLAFDAKKNNIFTSKDSLKSVNVDYVAGESNRIYTTDDAQFVNSSFKAPNNFVESGSDVILNNLEIKKATTNAEDTKTQIYANGNVTTDNVTNEDLTAKGGTYPQSVSVDRSGKTRTTLNVNKTKLIVQTDTVKDAQNPDNGTIKLDVKNANNSKAGVELTAQNVKALDTDSTSGYFKKGYYKSGTPQWDKKIEPKEGPEVKLNATDNEVAIAKIDTDKLTLDANDKKIADNTNGTPVITVKDKGGLNLDPYENYNDGTPDGFTYDKNYDTKDKTTTGGDLTFTDWTEWKLIDKYTDPDGTIHQIYESTRDGKITDKITRQTDQRHTITFDNNGNPSEFTLVYDKTSETIEPGRTIRAQDVKDDPTIVPDGTTPNDFYKRKDDPCDPLPDVTPEFDEIEKVTLPREQVEVSKTSTVADGTADQTSSIMSAAAKVNIADQEADILNSDNDEDNELD